MQRKLLSLLALCVVAVGANPAVQVEFNRAVNANQCLRQCMEPVRQSNLELSIFKRANYSDYLLQLDQICDLITDARHCIDACGVHSNPFALISMNAICSKHNRKDAKVLEPCLRAVGTQVHEQCAQVCGDYEALNDRLHLDTSTLKPEDQSALESLNSQTNNACSVLKCASRCAVDNFNQQCGQLSNGALAGNLIRQIVERVLATHRMDLEVFGLLDTMKKTTQPECNYLHTPDVLFNPLKDMISRQVIQEQQQKRVPVEEPVVVQTTTVEPERQVKLAASRLYVKILKKQLQVLDKQLEIMDKQEQKLDTPHEMPRFMQNPPQREYSNEMMF